MSTKKRKLRAILFADIVGYTALMQKDEAQASELLQKFRHTLNEKVVQHSGEIINNYGDGCLCTFESAVDAMTCAKAVQLIFQVAPIVPVRIGLHSGDVFFEDDNVFGDSVNIASRIESLGVAGAVLFSKRIKRDIVNQTEFKVQSLGEFHFKNVEKDMEVFALTNDGLVLPRHSELQGKTRKTAANQKKWVGAVVGIGVLLIAAYLFFPSQHLGNQRSTVNEIAVTDKKDKTIGVLPFDNLSDSKDNQYFADGMMEDILNNLTKVKRLKVISRTSAMKYRATKKSIPEIAEELNAQYLVEGSVQRYGNQVKIVVQLIDAASDTHLWSEKYERELKDIFQIQSEVAAAISATLKIKLLPTEIAQINYEPTANMAAYDLYLKANSYLNEHYDNRISKDLVLADSLFKAALQLEPDFALAKIGLANTFSRAVFHAGKSPSLMDSAYVLLQEAINSVPDLFEANYSMGHIEWFKGNKEKAGQYYKKATELQPNSEESLLLLAGYYQYEEADYATAIPLLYRILELNPRNIEVIGQLAWTYTYLEQYEKSAYYHKKRLETDSTKGEFYRAFATFYIRQAKFEEAININQNTLRLNPDNLWANHYQGELHTFIGKFEQAVPYFEKIISIVNQPNYIESSSTPPYRMRYAYALWNLGQKEKAKKLLAESIKKQTRVVEQDKYISWGGAPYDLAAIYAFLGEKEKAYYWLDQIIEKDTWMDYRHGHFDPMFENIRHEERFQAILKIRQKEVWKAQQQLEQVDREPIN